MSSILLKFVKNSFFVLCMCMLCACNAQKKYADLKIFDNVKQEFVGVDFEQKTALLVFYDGDCNAVTYKIGNVIEKKIKPNTQKLGLYLKMNSKAKFGYQSFIDITKNDIKWVSMQNRSLFGLISQCTKSSSSPFIIRIKNNQITSIKSVF